MSEMHSFIVKNTFVDIVDEVEAPSSSHRRCKSTPSDIVRVRSSSVVVQSEIGESLHEVRRRVFTYCADGRETSAGDIGSCSLESGIPSSAIQRSAQDTRSNATIDAPTRDLSSRAWADLSDDEITSVPLSLEAFLGEDFSAPTCQKSDVVGVESVVSTQVPSSTSGGARSRFSSEPVIWSSSACQKTDISSNATIDAPTRMSSSLAWADFSDDEFTSVPLSLEAFLGAGSACTPSAPAVVPANFACLVEKEAVQNSDAFEVESMVSTQAPSTTSSGARSRFSSEGAEGSAVRLPFSLDNSVNVGSMYPASKNPSQAASDMTTLMFRNLPSDFTRTKLEKLLQAEGFGTLCDFIYLPAEIGTGTCFGYAFVNMVTNRDAQRFVEHFQHFNRWPEPNDNRAVVHLSDALQGLGEQIERYRNSPLMHPSVADELRPAVYSQGVRMCFPAPTAPIKPPRVRTSAKKKQLPSRPKAGTL